MHVRKQQTSHRRGLTWKNNYANAKPRRGTQHQVEGTPIPMQHSPGHPKTRRAHARKQMDGIKGGLQPGGLYIEGNTIVIFPHIDVWGFCF